MGLGPGPFLLPAVTSFSKDMSAALERARKNILDAQLQQATHFNASRSDERFAVGDRLLLERAGINLKNLSRPPKYDSPLIGPYLVLDVDERGNWKLELPSALSSVHPWFSRSKLVRYTEPSTVPLSRPVTRPEALEIEGQPEFEVEKILGRKGSRSRPKYLVKWLGFDSSENSWEDAYNLHNAQGAIQDYLASIGQ